MEQMSIKVLLVDDQAMVRAGIHMILEAENDIRVVGEAEDGAKAIALVHKLKPDVVLMDIQMPLMNGLEATRKIIQTPGNTSRVLILTTFERDDYVFEALRAGASGFILKNAPPEDLIEAVRVIAEGNALLAPSITRRIINEFAQRTPRHDLKEKLSSLTEREIEVMRLIAKGKTNSEIAADLFVGETTVKTHISNLFTKLDLRDRVQAVVYAYESGLIQPGTE
jgi:DNA-binding NarL/FixJ family response regulator